MLTADTILVVPQATEVKDPQLPENNCILAPDVARSVPIADRAIDKLLPAGVNLYQTSSSGSPVAHPAATPVVWVANHTDPLLLVTPLDKFIAPAQLSLEGGPAIVVVMVNDEPVLAPIVGVLPAE